MYKKNVNAEGSREAGSAVSICSILRQEPHATAAVRGSKEYPEISGRVKFYQMRSGVLVEAEVFGLPTTGDSMQQLQRNMSQQMPENVASSKHGDACSSPIFGFHIHGGSRCSGNGEDPFADALDHYNPGGCTHPHHAGDMPPLFGNNGYAYQIFLTDRFTVSEMIGKTVIIHSGPDDFTTQPGGNSGTRIACGQIVGREVRR